MRDLIKKILKENYSLTDGWGDIEDVHRTDITMGGIPLVLEDVAGWYLLPRDSKTFNKEEGHLNIIKRELESRGIEGWFKTGQAGGRFYEQEHIVLKFDTLSVMKVFFEMEPVDLSKI